MSRDPKSKKVIDAQASKSAKNKHEAVKAQAISEIILTDELR